MKKLNRFLIATCISLLSSNALHGSDTAESESYTQNTSSSSKAMKRAILKKKLQDIQDKHEKILNQTLSSTDPSDISAKQKAASAGASGMMSDLKSLLPVAGLVVGPMLMKHFSKLAGLTKTASADLSETKGLIGPATAAESEAGELSATGASDAVAAEAGGSSLIDTLLTFLV